MIAQPQCTHMTEVWRGTYKMWYTRRDNFENFLDHTHVHRAEICIGLQLSSDAAHLQVAPSQPQLAPVASITVASATQRVKRHLITSRVFLKGDTPVLQNRLNYNLYTYH